MADLESIKLLNGDINEMRVLLKGDKTKCLTLFRQAVEIGDAILQIQLSHAFFGIQWGKDDTKDFSSITAKDLKEFIFCNIDNRFPLFNCVYDKAMETESDWVTQKARGREIFQKAADAGYIPAFLELKLEEWRNQTGCIGFAAQLRPFIGKGYKELDFYFGIALKQGSSIGSDMYYEGIYWMNNSDRIKVIFPELNQSFHDFTRYYVRYENPFSTYYMYDGLMHVGDSTILAPSSKVWQLFVQEKLNNVKVLPPETYLFQFDLEQIKLLLEEHDIGFVHHGSFVESSTDGKDIYDECKGMLIHGFNIDSISIYQKPVNELGEISVREDVHSIYTTFRDQRIQPIIDFIEDIMKRTGSAHSATSWLRHLRP